MVNIFPHLTNSLHSLVVGSLIFSTDDSLLSDGFRSSTIIQFATQYTSPVTMSSTNNQATNNVQRQGELEHVMIHYLTERNTALEQSLQEWQGAYHTVEERADRLYHQSTQLARRMYTAQHEAQASREIADRAFELLLTIVNANPNLVHEREQVEHLLNHPAIVIDLTDLTTDEELSDGE